MKKYDIIFIDIDGTLRDSNGKISKITKEKIKEIQNHGIKVVLCTGRSCSYAKKVAQEVGSSEYLISSNGSEVINMVTKEVIFNQKIKEEYLKDIFNYCKNNNINLLLNTIDNDYQTINESDNRIYINDISEVKEEVNQIVITSKNHERMVIIPPMFKEKYPELNLNSSSKELKTGKKPPKDYYHDFNSINVSKARGVSELLDYLSIPKERSISIGDSDNDLTMCELTGYCVAMGNAIDELKNIADTITSKNDDNGVANFIEYIL